MFKSIYKQIGVVLFFIIIISTSAYSVNLHLVEFNTNSYDSLQVYINKIEEKGITARHIFPPNTVIFEMYERTDKAFDNEITISQTFSSQTDGLNKLNANDKVHTVFKHLIQSKLEPKSNEPLPPLYNCENYGISLDSLNKANNTTNDIQTSLSNSLTGQYMIGHIAVGIYLMESTGSGENWWAAAEQITFDEIVEGLDWLAEEANQRGVKVVWVYAPVEKISTTFEPINNKHVPRLETLNWIFDWLDDIFIAHGLTDEWDGAYALANQLRKTYKTNWAVEFAVVMDENDADHMFADSYFAYVTSPGTSSKDRAPLVVMTYNNDGWGPNRMHLVAAHETGHIFGASDEYASSNCGCVVGGSFLKTVNGNCVNCNANPVLCLMRSQDAGLCNFTVDELGWRDSYDSDGASDPIDPNSGKYMFISPVSPGDLVRIYNSGNGAFANLISVTQNNVDNNSVFWSGITRENTIAASGIYAITKNGTPILQHELISHNVPSYSITAHSFALDNISISHNTAANFRHTIYDSLGAVFSRPLFDKSEFFGLPFDINISGYPDGIYTSEIFGWLGDGRNTNTSSLQFINYICGDVNNSGSVDLSDIDYLVALQFNNGPAPIHPSSSDFNCDLSIDISDLVFLVAFMFQGGPAPECCHSL